MTLRDEISILLIEDNKGDYILTREMLAEASNSTASAGAELKLTWANNFTAGLEELRKSSIDVILLDLSLPDAHGLDCFYSLRAVVPNVPIVVLTGLDDQKTALQAVKSGAQDYLVKGQLDGNLLARALRYGVERYQVLRALEGAKELAERSDRAKTEFLALIMDEIRTPLNGVIELISVVIDAGVPHKEEDFLKSARVSAESLVSVLHDVHDFSLVEAGRLKLINREFSLRKYLEPIVNYLEEQAQRKRSEFHVEISEKVPELLYGDPDRPGQIIHSLVDTAIKFGEVSSSVSLEIDVEPSEAETLHFAVKLDGQDLPLEKQEVLFESFAQADVSTVRKYGITGLTLAVAAKLIHLLGGRVWVESEAGQGTEIHFTARFGAPVFSQNEVSETTG